MEDQCKGWDSWDAWNEGLYEAPTHMQTHELEWHDAAGGEWRPSSVGVQQKCAELGAAGELAEAPPKSIIPSSEFHSRSTLLSLMKISASVYRDRGATELPPYYCCGEL